MNTEKTKLYSLLFAVPALLLAVLFLPLAYCRMVAACLLAVSAVVTWALFKKRGALSVHYRQVAGILAVVAFVYLVVTYLFGISLGFYKVTNPPIAQNILKNIIPAAMIIIATEVIRAIFLAQTKRISSVMAYLLCVLSDLALGGGLSRVNDVSRFMDIVGLTLFPAITMNVFCHYLVKRYGALPSVAFRLVLTVPLLFMPILPNISDALNSFMLIILPLAAMAFIDALYEKKFRYATKKSGKWSYIGLGAMIAGMLAVVMLISGQFSHRLLVIATPSMTGAINQGDAVIYEVYDGEPVEKGDVLVFTKDDKTLIVHRVVNIQNIDGNTYYTTKGDANQDADAGFVTRENVRGIVKCKVPHVGHPSLWLRDLFKK